MDLYVGLLINLKQTLKTQLLECWKTKKSE